MKARGLKFTTVRKSKLACKRYTQREPELDKAKEPQALFIGLADERKSTWA